MYAYVTLVMLGDEYVEGALVLAKSLLLSGTKHDLICMITNDVSDHARELLIRYYTRVVLVDFIEYSCPKMLTRRQDQLYGKWINYSFTKWQCLSMSDYSKIIYLDADQLVIRNIDHLFDLTAPALCFCSEYYTYYDSFAHGATITPTNIKAFFRYNKILGKTGTVVLNPDKDLLSTIQQLLNKNNKCLVKNRYHNGFDEQIFLQALIKNNISVTQLSLMYVWNAGNYQRLSKNLEPSVINYYGDIKPWQIVNDNKISYMDLFIWKYFKMLMERDMK